MVEFEASKHTKFFDFVIVLVLSRIEKTGGLSWKHIYISDSSQETSPDDISFVDTLVFPQLAVLLSLHLAVRMI